MAISDTDLAGFTDFFGCDEDTGFADGFDEFDDDADFADDAEFDEWLDGLDSDDFDAFEEDGGFDD